MKEKSKKITKLKQIIFLVLVLIIARFAMYIVGNGNISSLEGYLYSLAATATSCDATSCNATSTNAQLPCATCSNATSSNAQVPCATASNATSSNAKVPCATASNATNSEVVKNTTTKAQTTTTVATDKKDEKDNVEIKEDEIVESEDNVEETIDENIEEENIVETEEQSTVLSTEYSKTSGEKQEKEVVSFLESHRTYVIIIAFSILAIAIISFILYIDNKGIEKRKKAAETQENKNQDKPEQK